MAPFQPAVAPLTLLARLALGAALLSVSATSLAQQAPPPAGAPTAAPAAAPVASACPAQPAYPLPAARGELGALAERLEPLALDARCLRDAYFHAWRGAVLLALGRHADAVEALERALLIDPDLPGAQLDLAQAFASTGDLSSAASFIAPLRSRVDVPVALRLAIDRQLAVIAAFNAASVPQAAGWQGRLQLTSLLGADSNLNNAPAYTDITLTGPEGNVTLPLTASARVRGGAAWLNSLQWQGLRRSGRSLWVVQGELRGRASREQDTNYQQADAAVAWLQDPDARAQWVGRFASSFVRFGGSALLHANRVTVQRQFSTFSEAQALCRPTLAGEIESRRFPGATTLDGIYHGLSAGLLCRPASGETGKSLNWLGSYMNMELRLGADRRKDATRAGGDYRRAEWRLQWERPVPLDGVLNVQWSTILQRDTDPYSALLGNVPRRTLRHGVQAELAWPIATRTTLVTTAEASWQRSNIAAFESRQRTFYLGLRRELTH